MRIRQWHYKGLAKVDTYLISICCKRKLFNSGQSGADDTLITAYRRLDFAGSIAHVPRGHTNFRFAFLLIIQAADTIAFAIIAASGTDTAALIVAISCEAA